MVKKCCPNCGEASYSAAEESKWICPNCNTDITDQPAISIWSESIDNSEVK